MATSNVSIYKIKQNLSKVPEDKLKEINDFIELIIKSKIQSPNIVKFEGIWEGLGFEKINDLESDIRQIRKEATKSMLERVYKWNI
jgi:hypothetical protein